MNRRRVVQLVALGGFTIPLAGCSNEAADDEDASNGDEDETAEEEDEPVDEPADQEFSGSGDDVIEDVPIEGGLTIVDATHEGEDEFGVRLVPEDGSGTLFADSSGAYTGQTARNIDDGSYVLSVVADGDWDVTIQQPRDTSGERPPLSISGSGNEVRGPFEFDGTYQPSGDFDGESISVNILSSTGDSRQFVFNEGSITNPSQFEYEEIGYVEIKSDGEWSIEIE